MNVVLVDNHENSLNNLSAMLRRVPKISTLNAFLCPQQALAHLENHRPDCVWLEPDMPDNHGILFAEAVRQLDETVPIVFVSASQKYAVTAWQLQACHYLLQPVNPKQLPRLVDKCLHYRQKMNAQPLDISGQINAIDWHGKKARELFEYLIRQPNRIGNKYIACEALFPDDGPDKAFSKLQQAVYYARKSLVDADCGIELRYNVDSYQIII
ncbi:MAG: response regulator [Bacillota bacterium]